MKDSGFTLLELLVVCAIIGILASLALPNYWVFKANSYNSMAASDVRGVLPAAELVASEGGLPGDVSIDGTGGKIDLKPNTPVVTSPGVEGSIHIEENYYVITFWHPKGDVVWEFASDVGWSASPS